MIIMGKLYGDTSWLVAIASANSSGPSGDYIYLFIERQSGISFNVSPDLGILILPSMSSISIKMGITKQDIRISKASIISGTFTDINTIEDFLFDHIQSSSSPLYFYAKKGSVFKTFRDTPTTSQNYLKGYPTKWIISDKEGKLSINLTFNWCKA